MFNEMNVVFELDNARANYKSSNQKAIWCNKNLGYSDEESRKWRRIADKDRETVTILERMVEMKKAYLFG